MPSEALYRTILMQQRVEYAVCDAARHVLDYSPGLTRLFARPVNGPVRGQSLEDLFDELQGSQTDMERILRGELPSLHIEKIHRVFGDGDEGYLSLRLVPYPPGLLLLATDVTGEGRLEQRVTQQRNELDLLTRQLAEARAQLDDLLHRFVPTAVADQMIADPKAVRPGGARREVTILFADLRGFTQWTEGHEPELVLDLLNGKLAFAVEAILARQGTLDKFMGDAVMGIFNAPLDDPLHALHAVQAAWYIRRALRDDTTLQFGMGINTGAAVVGNVGTGQAMNYTAVGDAVNQAFRLQQIARGGQVIMGGSTYALVRDKVRAHPLGRQTMRGRAEPVGVYEITDVEL